MARLLVPEFADDILLFAASRKTTCTLVDSWVVSLPTTGLIPNPEKTVILTNDAQPPSHLCTGEGLTIKKSYGEKGHKWLGRMPSVISRTMPSRRTRLRLSRLTDGFLLGHSTATGRGLKYFDAIICSVTCFAAGHQFTNRIWQKWIFHFENYAETSCGHLGAQIGALNGIKFCMLGMNVQVGLCSALVWKLGQPNSANHIRNLHPMSHLFLQIAACDVY